VTIGGPGTENEMCWNLVTYWPRVPQPIDLCGEG
jgi:Copper type II ascorbate-dependent monooxygenase, C-terminal domain